MEIVKNRNVILPWSCSTKEWDVWTVWYNDTTRIVRQGIIHELVSSTTLDDDNKTINADGTVAENHIHGTEAKYALSVDDTAVASTTEYRKEVQTMRKLVADLTQEADRLRTNLHESEQLMAIKGNVSHSMDVLFDSAAGKV